MSVQQDVNQRQTYLWQDGFSRQIQREQHSNQSAQGSQTPSSPKGAAKKIKQGATGE